MENSSLQPIGKSERNLTMDALKITAIFLVLWGHSIQYFVSSDWAEEPVYRFIYSFHMPLFMTISGFFGANLYKKGVKSAIANKSRQLLVPIITFGLFLSIALTLQNRSLTMHFTALWYLNALLVCSLAYLAAMQFPGKLRVPALIISVGIVALLCYVKVFNLQAIKMYPFFLLGALLNRYYDWFKSNAGRLALIAAPVFVVLLLFWDERFFNETGEGTGWLVDLGFGAKWTKISLEGYRYVISFFGTLFFVAIFHFYAPRLSRNKVGDVLLLWGKYTLGVYVLQKVVLEMLLKRLLNFDDMNFYVFNFLIAPMVSFGVLLACIVIIRIIRKSRIASFAILGEKLTQK